MEEYIKLLELPEEFDLKDLKSAYRNIVLKYHPDKAANEAERIGYEALMKKLNEAHESLEEYLETHGGKYTKSIDNDFRNSYTEENYTEECNEITEEETQKSSKYEENSEIICKGEVNYFTFRKSCSGVLYLYPSYLMFEGQEMSNNNYYTEIIPLNEIKCIEDMTTSFSYRIYINKLDGTCYGLQVNPNDLWIEHIYELIDVNDVPFTTKSSKNSECITKAYIWFLSLNWVKIVFICILIIFLIIFLPLFK